MLQHGPRKSPIQFGTYEYHEEDSQNVFYFHSICKIARWSLCAVFRCWQNWGKKRKVRTTAIKLQHTFLVASLLFVDYYLKFMITSMFLKFAWLLDSGKKEPSTVHVNVSLPWRMFVLSKRHSSLCIVLITDDASCFRTEFYVRMYKRCSLQTATTFTTNSSNIFK